MKKQLKQALSMFLSAAMVVTMGSGLSTLTNSAAANAAEPVDSFTLYLNYVGRDANGNTGNTYTDAEGVTVTGNGDYTIVLNGEDTAEGGDQEFILGDSVAADTLYLNSDLYWTSEDGDSNLYNDPGLPVFKVTSISVTSDGKIANTFYPSQTNQCFGYQDNKVKNPLRTQVINTYSYPFNESGLDDYDYDSGVTYVDTDGDGQFDDKIPLGKGETMLLNVHVTGMDHDGINANTGKQSYYQQYHAYTTIQTDAEEKTVDTLITGDGSYGLAGKLDNDAASLSSLTVGSNLFVPADVATAAGVEITPTYVTVANEGAKAEEAGIYKVDATKLSFTGSETEGLSVDLTDALDKDFSAKAGQIVTIIYAVSGTGVANPAANTTLDSVAEEPTTPTTPDAPIATKTPIDTSAKASYNAYLGFQTKGFCFRDAWNTADSGLKATKFKYNEQIGVDGGTTYANATMTNAVISENNKQYTVSISGVNLKTLEASCNASDKGKFNMIFISTDIPLAMKGVTFSNATLKIDGATIKTYQTVPQKADVKDYYQVMLADAYAPDDGTTTAEYQSGKELATLPTSSMEITFTVSGADFNADYSTKTVGLAKGKTFTKGNFKYKVTTASKSTAGKVTAGKVQLTGLSAAGKKKTSVSVPAKVTKSGATYSVVTMKASAFAKAAKLKKITFKKATNLKALSKKAFNKATKLQTVVLGKKMKTLPASAFAGCKKLKTLTINAKLGSVNKKAFTGCAKKITIKGTSKKANLKKIKKVYKKAK